jgi:hypothetical protein
MGRYSTSNTIKDDNGKRKKSTVIIPTPTATQEDVYIQTTSVERLDKLAQTFYQDSTLWWVIAVANNLGKGTMTVPQNTRLRIPDKSSILNDIQSVNNER